jgi:hypothetical protein
MMDNKGLVQIAGIGYILAFIVILLIAIITFNFFPNYVIAFAIGLFGAFVLYFSVPAMFEGKNNTAVFGTIFGLFFVLAALFVGIGQPFSVFGQEITEPVFEGRQINVWFAFENNNKSFLSEDVMNLLYIYSANDWADNSTDSEGGQGGGRNSAQYNILEDRQTRFRGFFDHRIVVKIDGVEYPELSPNNRIHGQSEPQNWSRDDDERHLSKINIFSGAKVDEDGYRDWGDYIDDWERTCRDAGYGWGTSCPAAQKALLGFTDNFIWNGARSSFNIDLKELDLDGGYHDLEVYFEPDDFSLTNYPFCNASGGCPTASAGDKPDLTNPTYKQMVFDYLGVQGDLDDVRMKQVRDERSDRYYYGFNASIDLDDLPEEVRLGRRIKVYESSFFMEAPECLDQENFVTRAISTTAGDTVDIGSGSDIVIPSNAIFCHTVPVIKQVVGQTFEQDYSPYESLQDGNSVVVPSGQNWIWFYKISPSETSVALCSDGQVYDETFNKCVLAPTIEFECRSGVFDPVKKVCIVTPSANEYCDFGVLNIESARCEYDASESGSCPSRFSPSSEGLCVAPILSQDTNSGVEVPAQPTYFNGFVVVVGLFVSILVGGFVLRYFSKKKGGRKK